MSEKRTTARAFHDAVEVEDWRVLFSGAHAYFHVGSFADVGHFPDVFENDRVRVIETSIPAGDITPSSRPP
ncbi:MAG: hypothetical protein ABI458_05010 [Chloroflexota bacterium]